MSVMAIKSNYTEIVIKVIMRAVVSRVMQYSRLGGILWKRTLRDNWNRFSQAKCPSCHL